MTSITVFEAAMWYENWRWRNIFFDVNDCVWRCGVGKVPVTRITSDKIAIEKFEKIYDIEINIYTNVHLKDEW